ncbi:MAG: 50S ribosomal protein L11 methyltransferase [Deltaproteobacteria bacterium]|nr:MAG: 50S ribosomal protein L11 methyltransferase [Deltaproteobacteria bacterium]
MKWLEVKIIFDHKKPELATDLISQLLYELDAKGLVIEDPSLQPEEGWGNNGRTRQEHHAVKGYFPSRHLSQLQWRKLESGLAHLMERNHINSRIVVSQLDEADWAESWKAYFRPEKVGERLVVKPSWHAYEAQPDEIILEIDPGMAFGTGTHPTTRLCLKLIEAYVKPGDSVLDVGTGSGILMIAAAKLGAEKVCGIDKDKLAVDIAKKNLKRNIIHPEKVLLICGNLIEPISERFEMVAANLLAEAVINLLHGVKRVLKSNGYFLCSGIIKQNQSLVIDRLKALDFEIINIYSMEEWIAIAGKLR